MNVEAYLSSLEFHLNTTRMGRSVIKCDEINFIIATYLSRTFAELVINSSEKEAQSVREYIILRMDAIICEKEKIPLAKFQEAF